MHPNGNRLSWHGKRGTDTCNAPGCHEVTQRGCAATKERIRSRRRARAGPPHLVPLTRFFVRKTNFTALVAQDNRATKDTRATKAEAVRRAAEAASVGRDPET